MTNITEWADQAGTAKGQVWLNWQVGLVRPKGQDQLIRPVGKKVPVWQNGPIRQNRPVLQNGLIWQNRLVGQNGPVRQAGMAEWAGMAEREGQAGQAKWAVLVQIV